mmetsp:Transcript_32090/g.57557  ORF Transcript_32090/g.57557 Transcript_32090/m.57557 type:complete len:538 (-) Transcript_32090:568-2181(-)
MACTTLQQRGQSTQCGPDRRSKAYKSLEPTVHYETDDVMGWQTGSDPPPLLVTAALPTNGTPTNLEPSSKRKAKRHLRPIPKPNSDPPGGMADLHVTSALSYPTASPVQSPNTNQRPSPNPSPSPSPSPNPALSLDSSPQSSRKRRSAASRRPLVRPAGQGGPGAEGGAPLALEVTPARPKPSVVQDGGQGEAYSPKPGGRSQALSPDPTPSQDPPPNPTAKVDHSLDPATTSGPGAEGCLPLGCEASPSAHLAQTPMLTTTTDADLGPSPDTKPDVGSPTRTAVTAMLDRLQAQRPEFIGFGPQGKNADLCHELLTAVEATIARYQALQQEHALRVRHNEELCRDNEMHKRMVEQLLVTVNSADDRERDLHIHTEKREQAISDYYGQVLRGKNAEIRRLQDRLQTTDSAVRAGQDRINAIIDTIRAIEADQEQTGALPPPPVYRPLPPSDQLTLDYFRLVPKAMGEGFTHSESATSARRRSRSLGRLSVDEHTPPPFVQQPLHKPGDRSFLSPEGLSSQRLAPVRKRESMSLPVGL